MKRNLSTVVLIIVTLAVFMTSGFAYSFYRHSKQTLEKIQIKEDSNNDYLDKKNLKPLTFLLLGIGDRPNDPGRSDSIIILSVNPLSKSMLLFNIPRDTRVNIVGKGKEDKINHAYAYGGYEMSKNTVEAFLDQPIDYVMQINMNGFRELIDTLGGVNVYNPFAFSQADELGNKTYSYEEGDLFLTGEEALHYVRMRKSDPRGDLGRNQRQHDVLNEIMKKLNSFSSFVKMQDLLSILGDNVKTNMSFNDMKIIFKYYRKIPYDMETAEINGSNLMLGGRYYYSVSEEERLKISELLKNHISQTSPEDVDNN